MPSFAPDFATVIDAALLAACEPERAPAMQAYMKSAMPYLGVRVPVVRKLTIACLTDLPPADSAQLRAVAAALWTSARYREQRYVAIELLGSAAARRLRRAEPGSESSILPLIERFVRAGAWWDYVDSLAHQVGDLLRTDPGRLTPLLASWAIDDDFWIRRVSIICQLGFRSGTDLELLTHAIDCNAADREFFIRKAIGWALRDYARTDPDWVRSFVGSRSLSPLSRREALKHVGSALTAPGRSPTDIQGP
jgi:3-methyladenine DNA glycosylase AlkD